MRIRRMSIRDYALGDQARFTKTITETDAAVFRASGFEPMAAHQEALEMTPRLADVGARILCFRHGGEGLRSSHLQRSAPRHSGAGGRTHGQSL